MTLQDLAIDHPYYAADCNYYSNDATEKFVDWQHFYEEYHDADIDMNLVYRWDIKPMLDNDGEVALWDNEPFTRYEMQITIIGQRKGAYRPCLIAEVREEDVQQIIDFLRPHYEYIQTMWQPLTDLFKGESK